MSNKHFKWRGTTLSTSFLEILQRWQKVQHILIFIDPDYRPPDTLDLSSICRCHCGPVCVLYLQTDHQYILGVDGLPVRSGTWDVLRINLLLLCQPYNNSGCGPNSPLPPFPSKQEPGNYKLDDVTADLSKLSWKFGPISRKEGMRKRIFDFKFHQRCFLGGEAWAKAF